MTRFAAASARVDGDGVRESPARDRTVDEVRIVVPHDFDELPTRSCREHSKNGSSPSSGSSVEELALAREELNAADSLRHIGPFWEETTWPMIQPRPDS